MNATSLLSRVTSIVRRMPKHVLASVAALAVVGLAAVAVEARSSCCHPGAACCYPGSPCCHHAVASVP